MNIFMTGATGYVGSHCMKRFLEAGHRVTALTRRPQTFAHRRLTWHQGCLEEPEGYITELAKADTIIHLAMDYGQGLDRRIPDLIALRAFVRSGTHILYTGNLYTSAQENRRLHETPIEIGHHWWNDHEHLILDAPQGAAVIRLGFVYGGSGGYLWPGLAPNDKGQILQCGKDENRWPFIHVEDVAKLYIKAMEVRAKGIFHATDGNPVCVKKLLQTVTKLQGGAVFKTTLEDARTQLGGFADHMQKDIVAGNPRAKALGWRPQNPSLPAMAEAAYQDYLRSQTANAAQ